LSYLLEINISLLFSSYSAAGGPYQENSPQPPAQHQISPTANSPTDNQMLQTAPQQDNLIPPTAQEATT
jgi:hypothetical protein